LSICLRVVYTYDILFDFQQLTDLSKNLKGEPCVPVQYYFLRQSHQQEDSFQI